MASSSAVRALARVVAALPGGGEPRLGQRHMAEAVERAIAHERHLVVQAGTGTGKSLAYLVPAIESGSRTVVATATKALQDQLVTKDLPFLAEHLERPFSFAALKGRANYLCLQRAREVLATVDGDEQLRLDGEAERAPRAELIRLVEWGTTAATGDRADLDFEPSPRAWSALSVSARDCPGAARCPVGDACFAERARARAAEADVVVVNLHLYGLHLASGGAVLPEHDLVVIDEAHQLEETISATAGLEIAGATFTALARTARALILDDRLIGDLEATGVQITEALAPLRDRRLRRPDDVLAAALAAGRGRIDNLIAAVRNVGSEEGDVGARKQRILKAATTLADELMAVATIRDSDVAWVEGPPFAPRLKVAPLDVGEALAPLWGGGAVVVLTSATLPSTLPQRLALPPDSYELLDVGSPFDFAHNALLYCAAHLPDPRTDGFEAGVHDELVALLDAAGGRTLALFTSWRAMHAAVDAVRARVVHPILDQGSLPKPALVKAFADDESACLFATMGFWQGIDVAGATLSLVTIDRLPFPRPDEPLVQARRELARAAAFATVDLPRVQMLLAQGAGRLIRTASDRGVVAVFDPRLANATYRWAIVNALPPMRRTKHRAEAEAFLRSISAGEARAQ
ncbi:MAG: ATP-dependent DNA helicase [Acidimicrobiales bacterium]